MALAATATFASPAAAQGACSRELLQGIADNWISGVKKGSPFEMNLGEWVDYRENLEIGFLSAFFDNQARTVDFSRALLDTTSCKTFVEAVLLNPERPMVLTTQLTNGFFGVGPIDNLVTDKGDWKFDAKTTLDSVKAEQWTEIPADKRMSRQDLTAAANAWLDARAANGATTADRLYVIDEVLGGVNVLARLGTDRLPASFTFRIEDGQVKATHVAVNCGEKANCSAPGL
ncbi:hypothetical protein ASD76_07800 [Altererythrobacter sp. Root672]|nr:hypothetical protein ASD76_07800 [Altererythrobacter sp. Root672]